LFDVCVNADICKIMFI